MCKVAPRLHRRRSDILHYCPGRQCCRLGLHKCSWRFVALMVMAVTLQVRVGLEPLHELQRDICSRAPQRRRAASRRIPARIRPVTRRNQRSSITIAKWWSARADTSATWRMRSDPDRRAEKRGRGRGRCRAQTIHRRDGRVRGTPAAPRACCCAPRNETRDDRHRTPVLKNLEDLSSSR